MSVGIATGQQEEPSGVSKDGGWRLFHNKGLRDLILKLLRHLSAGEVVLISLWASIPVLACPCKGVVGSSKALAQN